MLTLNLKLPGFTFWENKNTSSPEPTKLTPMESPKNFDFVHKCELKHIRLFSHSA